jgi:hypothetical protein
VEIDVEMDMFMGTRLELHTCRWLIELFRISVSNCPSDQCREAASALSVHAQPCRRCSQYQRSMRQRSMRQRACVGRVRDTTTAGAMLQGWDVGAGRRW